MGMKWENSAAAGVLIIPYNTLDDTIRHQNTFAILFFDMSPIGVPQYILLSNNDRVLSLQHAWFRSGPFVIGGQHVLEGVFVPSFQYVCVD